MNGNIESLVAKLKANLNYANIRPNYRDAYTVTINDAHSLVAAGVAKIDGGEIVTYTVKISGGSYKQKTRYSGGIVVLK